jgi:hypothetical protein
MRGTDSNPDTAYVSGAGRRRDRRKMVSLYLSWHKSITGRAGRKSRQGIRLRNSESTWTSASPVGMIPSVAIR